MTNDNRHKLSAGFTLIEMIIYITLLTTTLVGALFIANNLIRDSSELNKLANREEEINFIFNKLEWAFAESLDINNPSAGSSSQSISIDKVNFDDNPIVFSYDTPNITMKVGQNDKNILNSELVDIDTLVFEHLSQTGDKPAGVKVSININGKEYETLIFLR